MYFSVAPITTAVTLLAFLAPAAATYLRVGTKAAPLAARQSPSPLSNGGCTYTCAAADAGDAALVQAVVPTGTFSLFCTYPAEICQYSLTDGIGAETNPSGCPAEAAKSCERRRAQFKREDNFTAMRAKMAAKLQASASASGGLAFPIQTPAAPLSMQARSLMGRKRRSVRRS